MTSVRCVGADPYYEDIWQKSRWHPISYACKSKKKFSINLCFSVKPHMMMNLLLIWVRWCTADNKENYWWCRQGQATIFHDWASSLVGLPRKVQWLPFCETELDPTFRAKFFICDFEFHNFHLNFANCSQEYYMSQRQRLYVNGVRSSDIGRYTCELENNYGSSSYTFTVRVTGKLQ